MDDASTPTSKRMSLSIAGAILIQDLNCQIQVEVSQILHTDASTFRIQATRDDTLA
jgi:hypothetical protein